MPLNSKEMVGSWLVISNEEFEEEPAIAEPEKNLTAWLTESIKVHTSLGSIDDPIYFSTDKYVYLICPTAILYYLNSNGYDSTLATATEQHLISLGLHEVNDRKDYFELPLKKKRVFALKFRKSKLALM